MSTQASASTAAPAGTSPGERAPDPRYVGGDPSLDLVNTADWTDRGPARERLVDYDALTRWAEGAAVLPRDEGQALRATGAERPAEARAALERARELRAVLQRLYTSVVSGKPDEQAWADFDRWLGGALGSLSVSPAPRGGRRRKSAATWRWRDAGESLDWFLHPVVRTAAELLTSSEARRVRVCDGDDCGWMFVDRSRNGLRRWCEMETCGTAAKTRRRRERNRRASR